MPSSPRRAWLAACASALLAATLPAQSSRPASTPRVRGSFHGVELGDVLCAIASAQRIDIALLPGPYPQITIELDHGDPLAALTAVAAAAGAQVYGDELGVLCVYPRRPASSGPRVAQDPKRAPAEPCLAEREVRLGCIEAANRMVPVPKVLVLPGVSGLLAPVRVAEGLAALRAALPDGVVMTRCCGAALILPKRPRGAGGHDFAFAATDIRAAAAQIARRAGQDVTVHRAVKGKVTMFLRGIPWRHALELAATAVNAVVVRARDDSYELRPCAARSEDTWDSVEPGSVVFRARDVSFAGRLDAEQLSGLVSAVLRRTLTIDEDVAPDGPWSSTSFRSLDPVCLPHVLARALHADVVELADGGLRLSAPLVAGRPSIPGRFRDADVHEVVATIAARHGLDVTLASCVRGEVTVTLDPDQPFAALEAAAVQVGAEITSDEYGVLCMEPGRPRATERTRVLWLAKRDVAHGAVEVAKDIHVSLVVGPGVSGQLPRSIDVSEGVSGLRAVLPASVALLERDRVFRLVSRRPPVPGAAQFTANGTEIGAAIAEIARQSGLRIALGSGVEGRVTMRVHDVPWSKVLELAARATAAFVVRKEDGSYAVRSIAGQGDGHDELVITFESSAGMGLGAFEHWAEGVHEGLTVEAASRPQGVVHGSTLRIARGMPFARLVADLLERDIVELADGRLLLSPAR